MYPAYRNTGRPQAGGYKFSEVPGPEINRSSFDRSCGLTTAFNSGLLIPIWVDEALPGDTFKMSMASLVRLTTPFFPIFDNVHLDFFFFAVPNRLVWDNWAKFMGEQRNPGDSTSFVIPQFTPYIPAAESLSDYMGIPVGNAGMAAITHNSLHMRAYNLVYNEWFRDENLQNSVVVDVDDGPDAIGDYVLLRRGKRHDYFTSSLPFPQKGSAVLLPLGSTAPVVTTGVQPFVIDNGGPASAMIFGTGSDLNGPGQSVGEPVHWANPTGLQVDLATATAATINQIREAFQIQKLLERDARGGTRLTEVIRAHFGVVSSDARLQRPEYLGGGSTMVNVHPVPRTTQTQGGSGAVPAIASLGAFGVAQADRVGFVKSFEEHCVLIGLVCVRADLRYQQGLERMWSRQDRYDFYWPELAHLGEQEVLSKEIYMDGSAGDNTVFGYQERFAEYRYKPSHITGKMRSTHATPLDQWHLAQEFSARPLLNATFISENAPFDRVLTVTTEPQFFGDFYFSLQCTRPMPIYSVPGLVDHF